MADTEMQEVDHVPSVAAAADTKCVEEEEPSVPEDKETHTLDTDLHLPDANEEVGGLNDQSEKKITGDDVQEVESSTPLKGEPSAPQVSVESVKKWKTWLLTDSEANEVDEAGTPEDQAAFIKEVEAYNKENFLDFKAPKFYGQPLNCLKLWRAVIKLGGYDVVTTSKLWRQVGESFNPPKTCTTVSWTFRIFYEKCSHSWSMKSI
ncbi:hypothetical protein N665_0130s0043 [Sinapis alba]|nr:hypothetical protein N665_0130s0043 [Sinapis alba]